MYLAIDIGGTKTLVATLSNEGEIELTEEFSTPQEYPDFMRELQAHVEGFGITQWNAAGVGVPAVVDYAHGHVASIANLAWQDVNLQADIQELLGCNVSVENDANLAGLSEAMLVKDTYDNVLYVTVSTGIGAGIISKQSIVPSLANSEPGHMLLEHEGSLTEWEKFASGRAIYQKYGMYARDITDPNDWQAIAENLGKGLQIMEAVLQPDVIIIGGSIGTYFDRYKEQLTTFLAGHSTPIVPNRPLLAAQRPEQAVIFGCYDIASR